MIFIFASAAALFSIVSSADSDPGGYGYQDTTKGPALFSIISSADSDPGSYGYQNNPNGPGQWGCLAPEYSTCRTGFQQSPIKIKTQDTIDDCSIGKLNFQFSLSMATLVSKRYVYEIELNSNANNSLILDGTEYRLQQFHFHHPSEHFINDIRFDLEMHLVFQSVGNSSRLAVVSELFLEGRWNEFIAQVLDVEYNSILDLNELHLGEEYFRYDGSLTTPPCTEGVTWTVLMKHKTLSEGQLMEMKRRLEARNARPLQQVNGREVFTYTYYKNFLAAS